MSKHAYNWNCAKGEEINKCYFIWNCGISSTLIDLILEIASLSFTSSDHWTTVIPENVCACEWQGEAKKSTSLLF